MSLRALFLLVLFTGPAFAADPPKAVAPLDLDKIAVEVLKDVHDRGADLYNAGDPAAAQKLYEGALRTVTPFIAHRPKTQTVIADGLTDAAKIKGVKEQAFRLHEVIEQVRAELKADIKKADGESKTADTAKDRAKSPVEPPPPPKPVFGTMSGAVTLDGKPLAGCSVTVVSLDLPQPRVFTATADAAGKYAFADPIPAGNYAVMITDGGAVAIPSRYQSTRTSGLTAVVRGGENTSDLALQSN